MTGFAPTGQLVEVQRAGCRGPAVVQRRRGAEVIGDVLAVDGAAERPSARRAATGDVARRPAPLGTGAHEQKTRNIEVNPACVMTTGTNSYRSVEGAAERVTDNATLVRLTHLWKDKVDWDFAVGDDVLLDTAAAHPALVFAISTRKVLAFTKLPYSQTRFVY